MALLDALPTLERISLGVIVLEEKSIKKIIGRFGKQLKLFQFRTNDEKDSNSSKLQWIAQLPMLEDVAIGCY